MGVSGCKSLVGQSLALKLGVKFIEETNSIPPGTKKMGAGIPLNDEDRLGWLTKLGDLASNDEEPLIIGCSALREATAIFLVPK